MSLPRRSHPVAAATESPCRCRDGAATANCAHPVVTATADGPSWSDGRPALDRSSQHARRSPVIHAQLDWQQGTALTAALVAARVAAPRAPRLRRAAPYLGEAACLAALYSLWQLAGSVSLFSTRGAFQRGLWLERLQHDVGLPSERLAQQAVIGHPLLAEACNIYYATMHFTALGIFLVWLFVRHRADYPFVRNVIVVLTAVSLVIQFVPVAPPRLLPQLGMVDLAAQYGQSVYQLAGVSVDELGAMPSVHVGWALLIGWAVIRFGHGRARWLVLAHPIVTVFVVAATANHFWLDGIVAAFILTGSIAVVRTIGAGTRRLSREADPSSASPAPVASS